VARPHPFLLYGAFALLTVIWGTTWAMIRVGLVGIPPFTGVALRFAIAAAILFALSPVLGVKYGRTVWEKRLWIINAICTFCISYGVVYWAEQWIPSWLASVLFATFPLFVAIMAHFALAEERLSLLSVAGIVIGFGGVAVIFSEDFEAKFAAEFARPDGPGVLLAASVMLVSPFVCAIAEVAIKKWGQGAHPVSLTAVPMAITAVVMGTVAALAERERDLVFDIPSVSALLYLAILGSAVTFSLLYWLLIHMSATGVSLMAYLIPVVAVVTGTVFLDEPLTLRILAGAALVIGGVALAGQARRLARPRNPGSST
jgi:drug/metabolite transporter (DMT)-like permease